MHLLLKNASNHLTKELLRETCLIFVGIPPRNPRRNRVNCAMPSQFTRLDRVDLHARCRLEILETKHHVFFCFSEVDLEKI